jgi:hypothetical protein
MLRHASCLALAALALAGCHDGASPTALRDPGALAADRGGNPNLGGNAGGNAGDVTVGATSTMLGKTPTFVLGNTTQGGASECQAAAPGSIAVKREGTSPPIAGYQFTVSGPDGSRLAFAPVPGTTTQYVIAAVLVKGGPAYSVYDYNGGGSVGVTSDAGLTSPRNLGGNIPGISHYVVCYLPGPVLEKRLVKVMDAHMAEVPLMEHAGMPPMVVIPQGEIRWLQYEIRWSLPAGVSATLVDDFQTGCAAMGGYLCTSAGFVGGSGPNPFTRFVTGSGTLTIIIDIKNENHCGDVPYPNTVSLSGGVTASVTHTQWLWALNCA